MNIGYLHLGNPEHGLHRYGRLLAAEAQSRKNLSVSEVNVQLMDTWYANLKVIVQAARQLSNTDIVHIQYNKTIWGEALSVLNLLTFMVFCKAIIVITLHDIYVKEPPKGIKRNLTRHNLKTIAKFIKCKLDWNSFLLTALVKLVSTVFVCTQQEKDRLSLIASPRSQKKIQKVPHFVERRSLEIDSAKAKNTLGLKNFSVVTLLGWVHRRKGHDLAVEVLGMLPENFVMVFAGKFNERSIDFANQLIERAKELGVLDRLRITGYLSETELEQYLFATDIALCPFRNCSASGSLSTWISVQHPRILASDLPQIREYNSISSDSVKLLESLSPEAILKSIISLSSSSSTAQALAVEELQRKLEISNIFDKHLKFYNQLVHV